MIDIIKKKKYELFFEHTYLFSLCLITGIFILSTSWINFIVRNNLINSNIILIISIIIFMLPRIFFIKFNKIETFLILISIFFFSITAFFLNYAPLCSFIIALCGKDICLKRIFKVIFITSLITTALITIIYFTGLSGDTRIFYNRHGNLRHSMGFIHPNSFGLMLFIIISLWLYLRREKLNMKDFVAISGIIFIANSLAKSRAAIIMSVFMLIIFYIGKKTGWRLLWVSKFFIMIPLFCLFITYFLTVIVPREESLSWIDDLLSKRSYFAYMAYNIFEINLFNTKTFFSDYGIIMDNGYLGGLISFGIIPVIMFLLLYTRMINNIIKNKDFAYLIICVAFLIYNIFEYILYDIRINFVLYTLLFVPTQNPIENNKEV